VKNKEMETAAGRTEERQARGERGFTLLGVLIAVLIMGTMATVAVPRFTAALAAANTAKIQADLTAIDTAIALYRIDKGVAPTKVEELENYLENYEQIKPPTGECNINGEVKEVPGSAYSISTKKTGRAQAYLGDCTVYDFGGKKGT